MIHVCPNCGSRLARPLDDGICICLNCRYDLSVNLFDRLMSAAWVCYRQQVDSVEKLREITDLPEPEAILVAAFMVENCYSTEEFRVALGSLNIIK